MYNRYRYYLLTLLLVTQSCLSKGDELPEKCLLTKLEEDIKEYRAKGSRLFLPTLKKLKKLYPGDKFRAVKEKKCVDDLKIQHFSLSGNRNMINILTTYMIIVVL